MPFCFPFFDRIPLEKKHFFKTFFTRIFLLFCRGFKKHYIMPDFARKLKLARQNVGKIAYETCRNILSKIYQNPRHSRRRERVLSSFNCLVPAGYFRLIRFWPVFGRVSGFDFFSVFGCFWSFCKF